MTAYSRLVGSLHVVSTVIMQALNVQCCVSGCCMLCHQKACRSLVLLQWLVSQIARCFPKIDGEWEVWSPVYHAYNNSSRLRCSLTSSTALSPAERVLWASTEAIHFRAMIRALLWGRYCAIVAEFQHNGLAKDLTHWGGRVQAPQPPSTTTSRHTHTHTLTWWHCLCVSIC